jgi:NhaA family Na+:H+ antiporter
MDDRSVTLWRVTPSGSPPRLRRPWSQRDRAVPRVVMRPLQDFLRWEASGGLLLLVATAAALVWANVALASYTELWSAELRVEIGNWTFEQDLLHIVNDGLMTLFFLVIGLEVKRELAVGELRTRRAAMLPVFAAAGGMLVPALVYAAVLAGGDGAAGWGIPMATDTAFALGVLALLGRRAPPMLTTLLLAVAVIDDLGAMTVMTVFYSDGPDLAWMAACVACLVAVAVLNRVHVRHIGPYLMLGGLAWVAAAASGVHPTVVGVALGLLTPARPFQPHHAVAKEAGAVAEAAVDPATAKVDPGSWRRLAHLSREAISPVNRIEHALHPWTSMIVVPLFALANAGIVLDATAIEAAAGSALTLGVILGLVVGKPLGLVGGAYLAVRFGLSRMPRGVGWLHLVGLGAIAGIGFTISLFITALAFVDDAALTSAAKVGILAGSLLSAAVGVAFIQIAHRRTTAARRRAALSGAATPPAPPGAGAAPPGALPTRDRPA